MTQTKARHYVSPFCGEIEIQAESIFATSPRTPGVDTQNLGSSDNMGNNW